MSSLTVETNSIWNLRWLMVFGFVVMAATVVWCMNVLDLVLGQNTHQSRGSGSILGQFMLWPVYISNTEFATEETTWSNIVRCLVLFKFNYIYNKSYICGLHIMYSILKSQLHSGCHSGCTMRNKKELLSLTTPPILLSPHCEKKKYYVSSINYCIQEGNSVIHLLSCDIYTMMCLT